MNQRQRRWRGPGWPWQAYERRGDAGYNVIFKGDLPKMWLGLLLMAAIVYGGLYLISLFERDEEDPTAYLNAVAACEAWEALRDHLDDGRLSQREQVEMAREIEDLARGSDLDHRTFSGIRIRLRRGQDDLGAYPDRADERCADVSQSDP